jgi:hypothetical protein
MGARVEPLVGFIAVLGVGSGCGLVLGIQEIERPDAAQTDDAQTDDAAANGELAVVQTQGVDFSNGGQISTSGGTIPIAATTAGNLLVVAVTTYSPVDGITDDAVTQSDAFVPSGHVASSSAGLTDIWYARGIRAGATHVFVTLHAPSVLAAWVVEVAGASADNPLDVGAAVANGTGSRVFAPVSPTVPHALVVSVVDSIGSVRDLSVDAGQPFVALPKLSGNDVAYFLAHAKGAYGAVWDSTGGEWSASTVAFK